MIREIDLMNSFRLRKLLLAAAVVASTTTAQAFVQPSFDELEQERTMLRPLPEEDNNDEAEAEQTAATHIVVAGETWFDFDDVTLFAKVFNVVDQQQLNATILTFGKSFVRSSNRSAVAWHRFALARNVLLG